MQKLFPRHLTFKHLNDDTKRRMRAHIILDRAQAGHDIPRHMIRAALRLTGDLYN